MEAVAAMFGIASGLALVTLIIALFGLAQIAILVVARVMTGKYPRG